jgi:transposase
VYWIAVYEVLEARGLKVLLVDSRALARVPGRPKTDRRDCQWIQLRQALYRASGADLTAIDGLGVETVQAVTSEYGTDLSAFPKEKQFVKHVLLASNRPTSGCKPVKKKNKHGTASSRVAAALRMAALSLRHSPTALGAYYRQIAHHKGDDVAVFATARKLATLIYRMLRWGKDYADEGAEAYEKRYREGRLRRLTSLAREFGYQLAPLPGKP